MTGKRSKQTGQSSARLREAEWDFSSLPPVEVPFCLLWELARESAEVERHVSDWRSYRREVRAWNEQHGTRNEEGQLVVPNGKGSHAPGERQKLLMAAASKFVAKINFPFQRDALRNLIVGFAFTEGEISPWQLLKPEERKRRVEQLCGDPSWLGYSGHPAVRTGSVFDFGALAVAGKEGRWHRRPGFELEEASCFDDLGREIVVLVIDWPGFNDTAIKQGLDKWWDEKGKPARPAPPVRRGIGIHHAQESCVMLDNLGYARLRARYTPKQLFENARAAWIKLMGPCEFEEKSAREFEGKLSERAERFWDWFPKAFPFDNEPPKSQRDFERRKTRTGPPKRNAPGGD